MFSITSGRGFKMKFANGWTVSVQFGRDNYCENRHRALTSYAAPERGESKDAEIAAWDSDGNWFEFGGDTVEGWCSPDDVAAFIAKVAAFPPSN